MSAYCGHTCGMAQVPAPSTTDGRKAAWTPCPICEEAKRRERGDVTPYDYVPVPMPIVATVKVRYVFKGKGEPLPCDPDERDAICERLERERAERVARMTPERRAQYEDIMALRREIGPVDFDVVGALREMRGE